MHWSLFHRPAWLCCVVALMIVQDGTTQPAQELATVSELRVPATGVTDEKSVRFEAVDILVDSADQSLAAWQLELTCRQPGVEIVGIEGGDHPAFRNPPYYDPRAIRNNRVILGAFQVRHDNGLPTGRQRVARVHVQVTGIDDRVWIGRLTAAVNADGQPITAGIRIEKSGG